MQKRILPWYTLVSELQNAWYDIGKFYKAYYDQDGDREDLEFTSDRYLLAVPVLLSEIPDSIELGDWFYGELEIRNGKVWYYDIFHQPVIEYTGNIADNLVQLMTWLIKNNKITNNE